MAVVKTQFTLRLDLEIHAKIKKIAERGNRSMSNMITMLIKKEIRRFEHDNGEIPLSDEDLFLK